MTLGQRISLHRKKLRLSQEALGERLGVSRQAVSKWERDAASPDMENLLALARVFQISVAELTETPEEPSAEPTVISDTDSHPAPFRFRSVFWPVVCGVLAILLVGTLALTGWLNPPTVDHTEKPVEPPPPEEITSDTEITTPIPAPQTDFAFLWYGTDGKEEFLELGEQEHFFPFGTTLQLTEPEEVLDTDVGIMTTHHADCGYIAIDFYHIEEDLELDPESPERESVWRLSTMVSQVRTPRGVHVGSTKAQVLDAYGDKLVYCVKEAGSYTLVRHDYYYALQTPETFGASLRFYMLDGVVAGICIEHMGELGSTAFAPDHISRFPLVDGEPDYSERVEPEQEAVDDTRRVYIAFNQLVTNNNLSAEEQYAYRRDVFSLLPYMDWQAFGAMGSIVEHDDAIFALLNWMANQDGYSASETLWLQMGAGNHGIDGAYAEMYAYSLFRAFYNDPLIFAKTLAADGVNPETMYHAISLTAYNADLYPNELWSALDTLESGIDGTAFSEKELGWARLLHLYLTTDSSLRSELPRSPAELPPA